MSFKPYQNPLSFPDAIVPAKGTKVISTRIGEMLPKPFGFAFDRFIVCSSESVDGLMVFDAYVETSGVKKPYRLCLRDFGLVVENASHFIQHLTEYMITLNDTLVFHVRNDSEQDKTVNVVVMGTLVTAAHVLKSGPDAPVPNEEPST